jgi:GMP synthase-like glutamine amidotransferase
MNRPIHVAVIDPATSHPELDTFNKLVLREAQDMRFTYHLPSLHGMQSLLLTEGKIDVVMILGSGASVNDRLEWQDEFKAWLDLKILKHSIPTLGICYGHQLIAKMFGGEVTFAHEDHRKYQEFRTIGCRSCRFLSDESLFILMSHREIVVRVPSGFEPYLSSSKFALEGLQHRTLPIWTISGHPEATSGFVANQQMDQVLPSETSFESGHRFISAFLKHAKGLLKV